MNVEGLNAVLETGRCFRLEYYEMRAKGFEEKQRHCLAKIFAGIPLGESISGDSIRASLTQEYSETKSEQLFRRAVEKGLLDERKGRYVVPIPSMQNWLVSNYAHIQIESPPQTMELRRPGGRDTGMQRER